MLQKDRRQIQRRTKRIVKQFTTNGVKTWINPAEFLLLPAWKVDQLHRYRAHRVANEIQFAYACLALVHQNLDSHFDICQPNQKICQFPCWWQLHDQLFSTVVDFQTDQYLRVESSKRPQLLDKTRQNWNVVSEGQQAVAEKEGPLWDWKVKNGTRWDRSNEWRSRKSQTKVGNRSSRYQRKLAKARSTWSDLFDWALLVSKIVEAHNYWRQCIDREPIILQEYEWRCWTPLIRDFVHMADRGKNTFENQTRSHSQLNRLTRHLYPAQTSLQLEYDREGSLRSAGSISVRPLNDRNFGILFPSSLQPYR